MMEHWQTFEGPQANVSNGGTSKSLETENVIKC